MILFKISELCFTSTAILYFLATFFYILFLGWRKDIIGFLATCSATLGVLLQTGGLLTRWVEAGFAHPPFTNLYETLLFMSWGIALFYVIFEFKYRFRQAGAFIFPVVMGAIAAAVLNGDKEIQDLVPALRSYWLHAHVATASLAYAGFTVSFGLSLMYLIKDDLGVKVLCGAGHFCAFLLLSISDKFYIFKGLFHMDPINMNGPLGHEDLIAFPLPGRLFLAALIFILLAGVLYVRGFLSSGRTASSVGLILCGLGLAVLFIQVRASPLTSLSANPFKIVILFLVILFVIGALLIDLRYEFIRDSLPEKGILDRLGYVSVIIAFPLMTLVIITGSVWAKYAWGDYWSWDPKETASLITWMVYTVYLHARMMAGWKGRRLAYISIVGFVSVLFTFLGVNLLLPGLHTYAT
jgi:ABC-type transport system involved in cytochrome c biogenesis permease subunit